MIGERKFPRKHRIANYIKTEKINKRQTKVCGGKMAGSVGKNACAKASYVSLVFSTHMIEGKIRLPNVLWLNIHVHTKNKYNLFKAKNKVKIQIKQILYVLKLCIL